MENQKLQSELQMAQQERTAGEGQEEEIVVVKEAALTSAMPKMDNSVEL